MRISLLRLLSLSLFLSRVFTNFISLNDLSTVAVPTGRASKISSSLKISGKISEYVPEYVPEPLHFSL